MTSQIEETLPLRGSVSSSSFPEKTRLNSWRELVGRQALRADVVQLDDNPFRFDMDYLDLPGARLVRGEMTAVGCTRTKDLLQDNNDDFVLFISKRGKMQLRERGKEIEFAHGDGIVRRASEVGEIRTAPGTFVNVSLPRGAMQSVVVGIDRLGFAVIPRNNPALNLLRGYLEMLLDGMTNPSAMARDGVAPELAARHVREVAGLAIDSRRDTWERLDGPDGGLRAARLAAIKADIETHMTDPDFSIGDLARRQGISPGYVRKLLAEEGGRFSDIVRFARLDLANRLLRDARYDSTSIIDIAYHCGFGDISYFNRCFRQRFDAAPGDIRRAARR